METTASLVDIQRAIGTVEAVDDASCDGFDGYQITFTIAQLERLVRRLGWRPTPSLADCIDSDIHFVCPGCHESCHIEHESDGPCDLRPVRGFDTNGQLIIEDLNASCCTEGDWWLRCRLCLLTFNPPAGLEIAWH